MKDDSDSDGVALEDPYSGPSVGVADCQWIDGEAVAEEGPEEVCGSSSESSSSSLVDGKEEKEADIEEVFSDHPDDIVTRVKRDHPMTRVKDDPCKTNSPEYDAVAEPPNKRFKQEIVQTKVECKRLEEEETPQLPPGNFNASGASSSASRPQPEYGSAWHRTIYFLTYLLIIYISSAYFILLRLHTHIHSYSPTHTCKTFASKSKFESML